MIAASRFSLRFRLLTSLLLAIGLGMMTALSLGMFESWFVAPTPTLYDNDSFARIELNSRSTPENSTTQTVPEGWPQLFGPLRNSVLPADRTVELAWAEESPPLAWELELGTGYSSPVIAAERVIAIYRRDDEEIVGCFALETGAVRWERRHPATYTCPHPPHSSGPYSTPLIDEQRVYTQGANGLLECLDLETGEPLWSRQLSEEYEVPENVFAVGHSPTLDGDQLILNLGAKSRTAGVIAIDKLTGQTRWEATDFGASYASPVLAEIHGQRYCFVLTAEAAVALDPDTGNVFWSFPHKAISEDFVNATSPVVAGDVVIFTAYQAGTVYSRVLPDGGREEIRHDRRNLVSQFNPLTVLDGYLYGWHFSDKSFRCLDIETGAVLWKWISGVGRGTHIVAGDRILLYGESGRVAVVGRNPHELIVHKERSPELLAEPAFSAPAMSGPYVLLKNEERLICLKMGL